MAPAGTLSLMTCGKAGCYSMVGRDGLNGFCAEHKTEAVMHGVEIALHRLGEQKKQIDQLEFNLRALSQQLRR